MSKKTLLAALTLILSPIAAASEDLREHCIKMDSTAIASVLSNSSSSCNVEIKVYGKQALLEEGCSRAINMSQGEEFEEHFSHFRALLNLRDGSGSMDEIYNTPECGDEVAFMKAMLQMNRTNEQLLLVSKY